MPRSLDFTGGDLGGTRTPDPLVRRHRFSVGEGFAIALNRWYYLILSDTYFANICKNLACL